MKEGKISIRAELVRNMMSHMTYQSLEYHGIGKEPTWYCPKEFVHEIIQLSNSEIEIFTPLQVKTNRVILQIHGGGYVRGLRNIYRDFSVMYSKKSQYATVVTLNYRLAPKYPYPAALEDALEAYQWILKSGYVGEEIVIVGDSAGGGLSLALMMYLRDHGYILPAGIIVMSPWTDLTCSGKSYVSNATRDPNFGNNKDSILRNSSYIGEHLPEHPYISPLFGDFSKAPPTLIQVGDYEMLLSDAIGVANKFRESNRKVKLSIYEGMFHEFQMGLNLLPESKRAWEEIERFFQKIYCLKPLNNKKKKVRNNKNENNSSSSRKNKRKIFCRSNKRI